MKTYTELIKLKTFDERLNYLLLSSFVGEETFGPNRYVNQMLYKSAKWKSLRREIIFRDKGCDLAHQDFPIGGQITIHHLNPIDLDDILKDRPCIYDKENLVTVSLKTHNAIHYGRGDWLPNTYEERKPNDTKLW